MNFKKIALLVAMSASFAAHADIEITNGDFTTKPGAVLAGFEAVVPELLNPVESNTAYAIQEGDGSVSYISQSGGANYAAVLQLGTGMLSFVLQATEGGSNNAVIFSKDTGTGASTDARATGLDKTTGKVAALAETEILGATPLSLLSAKGNVTLIDQAAAGAINIGYIYQDGSNSFAAIVQDNNAAQNTAMISQLGNKNRAYITQAN